jgi:predicted nucleic-acid-binding Zn-ribbon protein
MDHPTRRLDPNSDDTSPEGETHRLDRGGKNLPFEDAGDLCPKCGGERVWADVETAMGGNAGKVQFSREVGKGLFGPLRNTTICISLVCSECGFAEFYANKPNYLVKET